MGQILQNDWNDILSGEFEKPYSLALRQFLISEYQEHTIYPDKNDIFNAFQYTSFKNLKVVLLGQDPYHGPGQAHGLSFSVKPEVPAPPSLVNIFKELHDDLGLEIPKHGYLKHWAEQGVLLLNTVLTVRAGEANSHRGKGWEKFTDEVIRIINERNDPVVFWLWGKPAQSKAALITNPNHLILKAPHPSPLSVYRGFWGSKPFSKTNAFLIENRKAPIDWTL
ncbi:MAG: uracil-DNA glycosylase [Clostridiales bacterium 38-18]|nr:MAG: uracil-DNA glycosylase [Clostridiales bacterium 38-18]